MRRLCVLAALAMAGCDQAPKSAPAKPAHSASAAPKQAPHQVPLPQGKAIVDADGVIFDLPGGKTGEFGFGTPRATLEPLAERLFGKPKTGSLEECGAGPMTFARYGPLTFNFQDEKLVGWLAEEGARVVTSDGVATGKLMRDLKVARSARMIPDSTLEGEFDYLAADGNTIGGFVKGEGRDAKIVSLYAGTNCFFR